MVVEVVGSGDNNDTLGGKPASHAHFQQPYLKWEWLFISLRDTLRRLRSLCVNVSFGNLNFERAVGHETHFFHVDFDLF